MKLIKFIIFLSFCLNIYSAHAGITGTPTPKSTKTVDADSQKIKIQKIEKIKKNLTININ